MVSIQSTLIGEAYYSVHRFEQQSPGGYLQPGEVFHREQKLRNRLNLEALLLTCKRSLSHTQLKSTMENFQSKDTSR